MFLAQLKNELWKLFGKKRTYIGFAAFLLAQTAMMLAFKHGGAQKSLEKLLNGNGYIASEFISVLTVSVIILLPQIALLMPLYVALIGGDLVAKEAEDGTLRMILSRPISRIRLLFVKWSAGVIFAILLVLSLGLIAVGFASLFFPWKGMIVIEPGQGFSILSAQDGLIRFMFCHLFLAMNASVVVSVAFMFSCFNMKPAAATILALTFVIVSLVMENIPFFESYEDFFITHHFKCWLLIFQNPTPWPQICQSEIILFAVSATVFVIGAMAFQVRDIKS
ncbi:MAG: ABC transporter permease subunit [Limisphaerales bacterium]